LGGAVEARQQPRAAWPTPERRRELFPSSVMDSRWEVAVGIGVGYRDTTISLCLLVVKV
jgi:hypothetical protein